LIPDELLHTGFLRSADRWPERPALVVSGRSVTYGALRRHAQALAATIQRHMGFHEPMTAAVLADRSLTAFAGILGCLLSGRAYVPLNPNFPVARTRQMLRRAACRLLIVDDAGEAQLPELLDHVDPVLVILPARVDVQALVASWPEHTFLGASQIESDAAWRHTPQSADNLAYLLFTSGSTGIPKGVMVTHDNVTHFVQAAVKRYGITAEDRLSQMFDTTFDLSVFDMFVAWHQGACVCCPSRTTLWNPGAFIQEQRLTVWFSVPSAALLMNRLGALKPGRYPLLRWSLFCGERLTADIAMAWVAAAPGSTVENLYGPTELTIACTAYRWDPCRSPAECEGGVVPIGYPLPGMYAVVVDEHGIEVPPGDAGELLMVGPQRSPGYWRDEASTAKAFAQVVGWAEPFYRTGDRVSRSADGGPLRFLGRLDHQVKIRGHRVELGEVESVLLEVPGVESAAALGWPTTSAGAQGIAAFVTGHGVEPTDLRKALRLKLQEYAVPHTIHVLPTLPLSANGKVDRIALTSLLGA
jgi:amino acid adenylation domain-containing protein